MFFSYKYLKLKLSVSLTGYTVTKVTCDVMKTTITCSTMIGHLFDTIIVACALTGSGSINPSNVKYWTFLETVCEPP